MQIASRFLGAPLRKLRSFCADRSGIAAVEFGLIVPIMLVMMLGAIELSRAVVMARRFNLVTAMVSDLVARETDTSDADLTGIANGAATVWKPYDQTTLQMQVIQLRKAANTATKKSPGTVYVDWQKSIFTGSTPNAVTDGQNYSLSDPNMMANGTYSILVNATYTFNSLFGTAVIGMSPTMSWTSSSSHTPRNACVNYVVNGVNRNCLPTYE